MTHPLDRRRVPGLAFITAEAAPAVLDRIARHARRIALLSSMGVRDDVEAQADPINQFHADLEHLIEKSGLEWTFLRCHSFATNALWWAPQIRYVSPMARRPGR